MEEELFGMADPLHHEMEEEGEGFLSGGEELEEDLI